MTMTNQQKRDEEIAIYSPGSVLWSNCRCRLFWLTGRLIPNNVVGKYYYQLACSELVWMCDKDNNGALQAEVTPLQDNPSIHSCGDDMYIWDGGPESVVKPGDFVLHNGFVRNGDRCIDKIPRRKLIKVLELK